MTLSCDFFYFLRVLLDGSISVIDTLSLFGIDGIDTLVRWGLFSYFLMFLGIFVLGFFVWRFIVELVHHFLAGIITKELGSIGEEVRKITFFFINFNSGLLFVCLEVTHHC